MNILTTIGNAIWAKLKPLIDKHLALIRKDAKDEVAQLREDVMAEVAQLRVETLDMLREVLPEMAGAIAEQTVLTTFKHTQVDEAADAVSGVITGIVDRIHQRFPFIDPRGR